MTLRAQLAETLEHAETLRRRIAAATCAEAGCDMRHIGGSNACCDSDCCSCSVPVHECVNCGDCDYGENDEADRIRADCAIGRQR